jgi:uncharacterized membrane protein
MWPGGQYGPVSWEQLRAWAAEGRIGRHDFVWTAGMDDWARAESVEGLVSAAPATSSVPFPSVSLPTGGGTDGRTPNGDLTARARRRLSGHWGLPIAFCLLVWLINTAISQFPYLGGLAQLILAGPFTLGTSLFFLTFARGGEGGLGMMFSGFRRFGRALGAYLWMYLLILGWILLGGIIGAIAGGLLALLASTVAGRPEAVAPLIAIPAAIAAWVLAVIASLSYSQTFYIICDRPDCGAIDAVSASKDMMHGRKGKLFELWLRFIGWSILCLFTLGIGFLWLTPYMNTSLANFYEDLQPPRAEAQAALPDEQQPTLDDMQPLEPEG